MFCLGAMAREVTLPEKNQNTWLKEGKITKKSSPFFRAQVLEEESRKKRKEKKMPTSFFSTNGPDAEGVRAHETPFRSVLQRNNTRNLKIMLGAEEKNGELEKR